MALSESGSVFWFDVTVVKAVNVGRILRNIMGTKKEP